MIVELKLDMHMQDGKPDDQEVGKIVNLLYSTDAIRIELPELASHLAKGCSVMPAIYSIDRKSFAEQQVFMLDFDNDIKFKSKLTGDSIDWDKTLSPEDQCNRDNCIVVADNRTTVQEQIEICKINSLMPAFGYYTLNSTEEYPRWRFVYVCNQVISDESAAKAIMLKFCEIFKKTDPHCKNVNRIYFGGKGQIKFDYNNRFTVDQLKLQCGFSHYNNSVLYNTIVGTESQTSSIQAIQQHDVEYLSNIIGNEHKVLNSMNDCFEYFYTYDLARLLEIENSKSFRCIFHNDKNPSAGIVRHKDGHYQYKCFAEGINYNIINVVERIGNFEERAQVIKFLFQIFNIEIAKTEWQTHQGKILAENYRILADGEFEKKCPTAYKHVLRYLPMLKILLGIAKDNIISDGYTDKSERPVFFTSTRFLCKLLNINQTNAKSIVNRLALLSYHLLINKLSDENVPKEMLVKAKSLQSADNKEKHVNYFSFPILTPELLIMIEKQAKKWDKFNYTIKGCSREMFYRTEGKDVADRIYPQYTTYYDYKSHSYLGRTTSHKADNRQRTITDFIMLQINENGYCLENEIIETLVNSQICTKTTAQRQLKQSLFTILKSNRLKRIRANKILKQRLRIVSNGYPFVIMRRY